MQKKFMFLGALILILAICLTLLGCSGKTNEQPPVNNSGTTTSVTNASYTSVINWKMQGFLPNLPGKKETQDYFCKTVEELTKGQIKIQSFAAGEIVDSMQVAASVGQGVIQAGLWWPSYDLGKNSATAIIGENSMKMTSDDYLYWWYSGGGKELTNEIYNAWGSQAILLSSKGAQIVGQFKEKIDSLEKMKGKVLRGSGVGAMIYAELGLKTVTLAAGEIYTAMDRGVIDMVEFGDPADNMAMGFHEIAPYVLLPGWQEPASAFLLLINNDVWKKLTPDQQRAINLAAELTIIHSKIVLETLSAEALNTMKEKGCTFMKLSNADLATIDAACDRVLAKMASENPMFDKVLKSQIAVLNKFKLAKELANISYTK